ncbi:peptidoglycan-binding protein [Streptomyces sp. NPDC001985]|uniref:peptidoglycan-binding protein n=1 Tax=Streptomyces sp. NPDC001985 TaxID=3154406 RepID=UPI00331CC6DB
MTVPVFEEYEPASDCDCPGCVQQRRVLAAGGHPAAHGCRRALVLFTAAGVVLGGGGAGQAHADRAADPVGRGRGAAPVVGAGPGAAPVPVPAAVPVPGAGAASPGGTASGAAPVPGIGAAAGARADEGGVGAEPGHEQGGRGPLHGRPLPGPSGEPAPAAPRETTRAEIIARARGWVDAKVPYSMQAYWTDGYRQDCSGYVSMAWNLAGNEWTGTLAQYGTRIAREDLQPGDILLFHNPASPTTGSHVTIFGGWTDATRKTYVAYEQTKPHTLKRSTPMAYWSNSDRYVAYRYNGVTGEAAPAGTAAAGGESADSYPGASAFGPGAVNAHVTRLGELLIARGGKRFYTEGPGPEWGEADRRATEAFQLAQGWRGAEADGLPGPETWRLLVTGTGRDIPPAPAPGGAGTVPPPAPGGAGPAPAGGAAPASGGATPAPARGSGGVAAGVPAYPGPGYFRPGAGSDHVTRLGRRLVELGHGRHYTEGPGPRWSEADRRNVESFQRAQGWSGPAADGYPGPETWRRLFAADTADTADTAGSGPGPTRGARAGHLAREAAAARRPDTQGTPTGETGEQS